MQIQMEVPETPQLPTVAMSKKTVSGLTLLWFSAFHSATFAARSQFLFSTVYAFSPPPPLCAATDDRLHFKGLPLCDRVASDGVLAG